MLPPVDTSDELITLAARAAHGFIRERKAAIEQAELLLQRGVQRDTVLAILEYLARHDLMNGVREKAQHVLNQYGDNGGLAVSRSVSADDARHRFGVRCKHGHISYFDKRDVCQATFSVPRGLTQRAGKELDELLLSCTTCGESVAVRVDCEGYK